MRKRLVFVLCFLTVAFSLAGLLLYDWTRTAAGQDAPEGAATFVAPDDIEDSDLYL